MPSLVNLLRPNRVTLATAACNALMAIAIAKEGKEALVAAPGGLAALVKLLDPTSETLCVNAMVCMTNAAEAPQARPVLSELGAVRDA